MYSEFFPKCASGARLSIAFLPPANLSTRNRCSSQPLKLPTRARQWELAGKVRPATMIISPDDTAPDMLTFALSGPGLIAAGVLLASFAAALFAFADIGPRRTSQSREVSFVLLVTLLSGQYVELPNGSVRQLPEGETLLQLDSFEACTAVARTLEDSGASYTIYRADRSGLRELTKYPREVDVRGTQWPRNIVQEEDQSDPEARWAEYEQLGASGSIDAEWKSLMQGRSYIKRVTPSNCKLCGGSGRVRCHRCGGMAKSNSRFTCDCTNGFRECEWCGKGAS